MGFRWIVWCEGRCRIILRIWHLRHCILPYRINLRHLWQGYLYRILAAQGVSAPGRAYDYRLGDNMTRGFALIAWPAEYADSGVMSFMISHEGQVFEKDLGPDGAKLATSMGRFDPDSSWSEVAAEAEVEALATP